MSEQPEDAPGSRLTFVGIVALILWALSVLILSFAGWIEAGILGLLAGAVVGAILGALIIPLVAVAVYALIIVSLSLFMFISCGTIPLPVWPSSNSARRCA